MSALAARLADIQARIAAAALAAGRQPSEVQLVAVSKTQPASALAEAHAAGQLHFGENYAQELTSKAAALPPALHWHFIGRLQRNKAKEVAPLAYRVHAVDSLALGEALAKRAPAPLTVLVAVNLAKEDTKGGVSAKEALPLIQQLSAVPNLRVAGLMTMPPYDEDPASSAPFFAELASLAAQGRAQGLPLHELSMGMSHDFEVAIQHGATWVRVGTALFGARA